MTLCGQLGNCMKNMKNLVTEATCEECIAGVAAVADIFVAKKEDIIAFLAVNKIETNKHNLNLLFLG